MAHRALGHWRGLPAGQQRGPPPDTLTTAPPARGAVRARSDVRTNTFTGAVPSKVLALKGLKEELCAHAQPRLRVLARRRPQRRAPAVRAGGRACAFDPARACSRLAAPRSFLEASGLSAPALRADASSATSSARSYGAVTAVGAAVGGALLVLAAAGAVVWRQRERASHDPALL